VTVGVLAPVRQLVRSAVCAGCDTYPCACRLDRSARSEACLCGGQIRVYDRSDPAAVMVAVTVHNSSTDHAQWAIAAGWR
jgi:hypothetical protein